MLQTTPGGRLAEDLARIEEIAARPAATARELAANLNELYAATYELCLDRYELDTLLHSAPEIAQAIFAMRLRLRSQIADWHARGFLTRPGERALRNALRIARYVTDMMGEINIRYAQLGPNEKTLRGFSGRSFNTFVNPKFETGEDIDFRTGDLLLMRGMAHNSAAIARIGDVDSQFSHLAMIYTDANGKHWVVEALIETGSVINPLSETLHHGLGRCIVFRHRDPELAARAAAMIYQTIAKSHQKRNGHIWYDFSMELEGNKELFCSKLVREAFRLGSENKVALPTFMTRFDMRNRDFVDRIGVTARETFAPADIEMEPDFDVVAEWQDYRVTSRLRLQDLLMDQLFHWMETHDYRFEEDFPIRLIGWMGQMSGQLSTRAKQLIADVVPTVPPNMTRSAIKAVAMLHRTAEPLLDELQALERRRIDRTGRPLHPREVYDFLETKRESSNGAIGYLATAR
ncbi:YiiX/YebB-like N1pC/P60 family cysteine hydrolase [Hyphomicrobium sulfonivorans]|uniref:Uncharacterized protein n=1 Tax=Hyphomicrobium sulfonivorans TaxID=121290 RepID=A0A120CX95_HYPSL|nr:YiiX/YebB-like N1pC/P60 family cysteine hydrolase [Hyphomicrobium sulfonivorans]KWT70590.1 hypothetical protein APY04_0870 [Hyphomicrobium sulfonivorans]MBI1649559.1 hypothetical protein [Hyphomicrobium sulfonivorans]NSL71475.1 hypothetical protein [Hyphomicrobium sulfonivorans]